MKHSIKFYPVGNGDCDLITIGGANKKMMFDCNFRKKAEEENEMLKGCILEMSETVYQ